MAVIIPTFNTTLERLTTVTWANLTTGDTAAVHAIRGKNDLLTVQAEGTFSGGTRITMTGSLSNVAFITATDMTQTAIAFTSNGACGILEPFTYWKPTIASGSSDSITVTLAYWKDE
jgi:hypothetical protein